MKKIILDRVIKEPISSAAGAVCFVAAFILLATDKIAFENFWELLGLGLILLGVKDKNLGIRRNSLIWIAALVFISASCITQKKCQKRFPPEASVKDSSHTEIIIEKRDSIIHVPGETIYDTIRLECDTLTHKIKPVLRKKSGTRTEYRAIGQDDYLLLEVSCLAKDILITNLKEQLKISKSKEVTKTIPVIKTVKEIPFMLKMFILFLSITNLLQAFHNFKK
jgi:hypothetical protein